MILIDVLIKYCGATTFGRVWPFVNINVSWLGRYFFVFPQSQESLLDLERSEQPG